MDKKITELNDIRNISKSEYLAVANSEETYKLKISDLQKAIVTVDNAFSETSENPIQNKIITEELSEVDSRISVIESKPSRLLNIKVGDVYTEIVDSTEEASVEIIESELDSDTDTKTLSFKFFIPRGSIGENGNDGVSTRIAFAFKTSMDRPEKPKGGYWDVENDRIVLPAGWNKTDNLEPPVWMSSATFSPDGVYTDWIIPIKVTGDDGVAGTDGVRHEYIYKLYKLEQDKLKAPYSDPDKNDYIPTGWSDHPMGVTNEYRCEYVCIRYNDPTTGLWKEFSTPTLWSKYGVDGRDGDGVEYIYQLTKTEKVPATPGKTPAEHSPTQDYQKHEFIPASAEGENAWTDNPSGISELLKYEWVSVRKFKHEDQLWGDFTEPSLWCAYGKEGEEGPEGPQGPQGPKGDPGSGVAILGSFDSYEDLIAAHEAGTLPGNNPPKEGDGYMIQGELYVWDGDSWVNCGNIKGEPGDRAWVHIKFADYLDENGYGINMREEPGRYQGIYCDWTELDSTDPTDYMWFKCKGEDGFGYEYIYQRSTRANGFNAPMVPDVTGIISSSEYQSLEYVPTGWTDEPTGVDATNSYEWCCYRKRDENGVWGPFTGKSGGNYAWLYAMYAEAVSVPGDTGNPGPVVYPAGEWAAGTYTQTVNSQGMVTATPYVVHGTKYYVLIVESTSAKPGNANDDWLEIEKFNALYTEILLADKANVGKACFYGNYMFSRGGTGNFEDYDYTLAPYADSQQFKPAWCVDLITGEMWAGTGTTYFAADGSGYVANGGITWDKYGNINKFPKAVGTVTAKLLSPYTFVTAIVTLTGDWGDLSNVEVEVESSTGSAASVFPAIILNTPQHIRINHPESTTSTYVKWEGECTVRLYVDGGLVAETLAIPMDKFDDITEAE